MAALRCTQCTMKHDQSTQRLERIICAYKRHDNFCSLAFLKFMKTKKCQHVKTLTIELVVHDPSSWCAQLLPSWAPTRRRKLWSFLNFAFLIVFACSPLAPGREKRFLFWLTRATGKIELSSLNLYLCISFFYYRFVGGGRADRPPP